MKNPRRIYSGFTITEVLIVLVVVGVIASLVVLAARKLMQMAAIRGITAQIENVVATHAIWVAQKGEPTDGVGWRQFHTPVGTNYSASELTHRNYCDIRMVYVANDLMRFDDVMLYLPRSLHGGISGPRIGPDWSTLVGQVTSTDGVRWSRTPDIAITLANGHLQMAAFEADGVPYFAVAYAKETPVRPKQDGVARTGNALLFTMYCGDSTYQLIESELESRIGQTKGFYIRSTSVGTGIWKIEVTSPSLTM